MKKTSRVTNAFNRREENRLPAIVLKLLPKSANHVVIHDNLNCDADKVVAISHLFRVHLNEDFEQLWEHLVPRMSAILTKCGAKDYERIKHHKDAYLAIEVAYKGRGLRGIFSILIFHLGKEESLVNLRLTEAA